jgi:hypothetical protein
MKGGLMACQRVRNNVDCQGRGLGTALDMIIRKSWEGQEHIIKEHIGGLKFVHAQINKEIPCWSERDLIGKVMTSLC